MEEMQYLLEELEKVRKERKYKSSALCAYVNMLIRANRIEVCYELMKMLDEKNTAILIRNILRQFMKTNLDTSFLKRELVKGNSENEFLVNQYKAVLKTDSVIYFEALSCICEII